MSAGEDRGMDALRGAVEGVATDLDRRARTRRAARAPNRVPTAALAFAAIVVALAVVLWPRSPRPISEVTILELKIHGRPVRGVVLDDAASGGLVVMPQVPGVPRAAARTEGGVK